ncbi:MAG: hypothetical protein ACFE9Q_12065 [Candidatus Hodarchaeota archaeon]
MSIINYPPQEVINPTAVGKKNYEHIILWMVYNNEECEWFDFLQSPLEIPTSTLSRHLNTLMSEGYITKISKGHYKITTEGRGRFHDISRTKEKKRKLSFPPKIILKSRNYDHWILWMVYNNNYCKWSDFLGEPLSINQSSLSKTMRLMIKIGLIRKDIENKEYRITQTGKSEYSRILKYYDLDYQTILEEESKRIEEISKKTINFFNNYNIKDKRTQFRFLHNALKMDYNRVKSILKNEEDFHKILLFLSINHPNQYPDYISSEEFSKQYEIKENTLTYYIDEIVDHNIYPIRFFKLAVPPDMEYYFQENEKLETMLRAITKDKITEFTYLNKLFTRSLSFNTTIEDLLEEICTILFDEGLKESLREFIPEYINFLAYKIESESILMETYNKLEGIIWQNIADIFQLKVSEKIERQYEEELKKIDKDININLNNIDLYYAKIKILLYFGQYDKILELLDNMLKIFPDDEEDIKILKAYGYKRMQDLNTGLEIINELIQKYPENSDLFNYKAYWLQYLNKKEESLKTIRDLIEKYPDIGLYHDTYGEILMYFEDYKNAVLELQNVLELASDEWYINQTYIKLGICYKELGEFNLAVENLKKGKELTNKASIDNVTNQKWQKIADIFLTAIKEEL